MVARLRAFFGVWGWASREKLPAITEAAAVSPLSASTATAMSPCQPTNQESLVRSFFSV